MTDPGTIDFQLHLIPWLREQLAADAEGATQEVLDDLHAKGKIVDMCDTFLDGIAIWKRPMHLTLRWMTYPYRDRPGFDPEWRQWP